MIIDQFCHTIDQFITSSILLFFYIKKNWLISYSYARCRKEIRCLRRKDVMEALAKSVPAHTIRYGCRIVAVDEDPGTDCTVLTMADDSTIKAKVNKCY